MTRYDPRDRVVTAVLGPTNTGKTRLAIERMLAHESGMIGLPLRLLAREVYDRCVEAKGPNRVALLTGEEKINPPGARYHVCTVEAMPSDRETAFVAIDEVQLAADPDRGHVFTDRLLHARGRGETMLLGSNAMAGVVRALAPEATHETRERFSTLSHVGPLRLGNLPPRTAIVAFSAAEVYAIAEYMKRRRGGAAVVMGALSPRTRNAQVALYQSGEVDMLVATDAIGMGLNMDVDHVAFARLSKFDGHRRRTLRADELAQIAGRAGRFRNDGTFGVTGDARPLPEAIAERIENHRFDPISHVSWRASALDFSSLDALRASLNAPAPTPMLRRARNAIDEAAFDLLRADPDLAARAQGSRAVARLWSACQLPDFRKVTVDQHVRLVGQFAQHLLSARGHAPEDWIAAGVRPLDDLNGEVDTLSARLAYVRTWTYAANRADWLENPEHWRGVTRAIEDRLSDRLHEKLIESFVDRRTSALLKGIASERDLHVRVDADGAAWVEGHRVGALKGLTFIADQTGDPREARALRAAALSALRPEIDARLFRLARAEAEMIHLDDEGRLVWEDMTVGRLEAGSACLRPRLALIGAELGGERARLAAQERLAHWLEARVARLLRPLLAAQAAARDPGAPGPLRGLAFQLFEGLGVLERRAVAETLEQFDPMCRKALRAMGFRLGTHVVYAPDLVRPQAAALLGRLASVYDGAEWRPPSRAPSHPTPTGVTPRACAAAGYAVCGPRLVRLDILERLADAVRLARAEAGLRAPFPVADAMLGLLGCGRADLAGVLRALGYRRTRLATPATEAGPAQPELWSPPRPRARPRSPAHAQRGSVEAADKGRAGGSQAPPRSRAPTHAPANDARDVSTSPFAVLAVLKPPPPPARRRRKRARTPSN